MRNVPWLPSAENAKIASLRYLQQMCGALWPSLPLAQQLCRCKQQQCLPYIPYLAVNLHPLHHLEQPTFSNFTLREWWLSYGEYVCGLRYWVARSHRCCNHAGYLNLLPPSSDATMLDPSQQLSSQQDKQWKVCKISAHCVNGRKRDEWLCTRAELFKTQKTWLRRQLQSDVLPCRDLNARVAPLGLLDWGRAALGCCEIVIGDTWSAAVRAIEHAVD